MSPTGPLSQPHRWVSTLDSFPSTWSTQPALWASVGGGSASAHLQGGPRRERLGQWWPWPCLGHYPLWSHWVRFRNPAGRWDSLSSVVKCCGLGELISSGWWSASSLEGEMDRTGNQTGCIGRRWRGLKRKNCTPSGWLNTSTVSNLRPSHLTALTSAYPSVP